MTGWSIQVPAELPDKGLTSFFRGWKWMDDPPSPVTLDFSQTNFVAPWAATLFAAYGVWLREVRGKEVRVWIDETTSAGNFLLRSGLQQVVAGVDDTPISGRNDRILPLRRIRSSSEIPTYASEVMRVLALDDEEVAGAIKYSIVELLRNVVQHSRSRIGGLALATYYPTVGLAEFVVADIGCGVRVSLRDRYPDASTDLTVATGPFTYMASKEPPDATASIIGAFITQISYVIPVGTALLGAHIVGVLMVLLIVLLVQILGFAFSLRMGHAIKNQR